MGTAFIALEIPVHSMLELQSLGRVDMDDHRTHSLVSDASAVLRMVIGIVGIRKQGNDMWGSRNVSRRSDPA
jgi:hypothetical protein